MAPRLADNRRQQAISGPLLSESVEGRIAERSHRGESPQDIAKAEYVSLRQVMAVLTEARVHRREASAPEAPPPVAAGNLSENARRIIGYRLQGWATDRIAKACKVTRPYVTWVLKTEKAARGPGFHWPETVTATPKRGPYAKVRSAAEIDRDRAAALALRQEGWMPREIARITGIPWHNVGQALESARRLGLTVPPSPKGAVAASLAKSRVAELEARRQRFQAEGGVEAAPAPASPTPPAPVVLPTHPVDRKPTPEELVEYIINQRMRGVGPQVTADFLKIDIKAVYNRTHAGKTLHNYVLPPIDPDAVPEPFPFQPLAS